MEGAGQGRDALAPGQHLHRQRVRIPPAFQVRELTAQPFPEQPKDPAGLDQTVVSQLIGSAQKAS